MLNQFFIRILFSINILFLLSFSLKAQEQSVIFEKISMKDGLSHNNVNCIYQDHKGFIWFGTDDGLNKYDGHKIVKYKFDIQNDNSISGNVIHCITEDADNNLWIGTLNGLNRFVREKDHFVRYFSEKNNPNSISNNNIGALERNGNEIWIGTLNSGISVYNIKEKTFKHFANQADNPNSLSNNNIRSMYKDHSGKIWVGTENGLNLFDKAKNNFRVFFKDSINSNRSGSNYIYDIYEDNHGKFWLSTYEGLIQFLPENQQYKIFLSDPKNPNSLSDNTIKATIQDKQGRYWIGTRYGLNCYEIKDGTFTCYKAKDNPTAISGNEIWDLFIDKQNIIWIGTFTGGVNYFNSNPSYFKTFRHDADKQNSLSLSSVSAFLEDSKGNLWVGTDGGGLNMLNADKKTFTRYKHSNQDNNSLSSDAVLHLYEDKKGVIWIGTWSGGVDRFNPATNTFQHLMPQTGNNKTPNNPNIWWIMEDSRNNIWMATVGGGANMLDTKTNTFKYFTKDSKEAQIADYCVWTIYEDSEGYIWLGGLEGLNRFDYKTNTIKIFKNNKNDSKSISNSWVISICEDTQKNLWIGTHGGGLNLYDRKTEKFSAVTDDEGLANNLIVGLLCDKFGNLWMSTNAGISRYNPTTKVVKNYTVADGLQGDQFNLRAFYKMKNGDLCFGGLNGYSTFTPGEIKGNQYIPPVYITDFNIFNKPVHVDAPNSPLKQTITECKELTLEYSQSVFSFEFTTLNYLFSEKNQFAYKLEGFDPDWQYIGNKRTASYTNLNPGTYTLKIKASNNEGVWNEKGTSLKIKILPPWWMTWWFRVLIILLVSCSSVGFYFYRMNQVKRKNAELEKMVKQRTAALMEANEEILQQNEEINAQKDLMEEQNQDLEFSYNNMLTISEFGQKISSTLEIDFISLMLYEYLSTNMEISVFGIAIFNPTRKVLAWKSFLVHGKQSKYFEYHVTDRSKLAIFSFHAKNDILISNFNEENDYTGKKQDIIDSASLSLIYIPLMYEEKTVGVLTIQCEKPNVYSRKEYSIVRSVASYVSISIKNADTYEILHSENKKITDSINYARSIQATILPEKDFYSKYFDSFIIYKPKDLVSGDFYWFTKPQNTDFIFLAVVDCTGHGVPGAFMSMIGNILLNIIVIEGRMFSPSEVLNQLDIGIIKTLRQERSENLDGMDICFCRYDLVNKTLCFSGAKSPLWRFNSKTGEMVIHKGSRRYIGGKKEQERMNFTETEIQVAANDVFYLASDGFTDQNNSERNRYGSPRLLQNLKQFAPKPLTEQKQLLEQDLEQFTNNEEQRDDITLWGVKFI